MKTKHFRTPAVEPYIVQPWVPAMIPGILGAPLEATAQGFYTQFNGTLIQFLKCRNYVANFLQPLNHIWGGFQNFNPPSVVW